MLGRKVAPFYITIFFLLQQLAFEDSVKHTDYDEKTWGIENFSSSKNGLYVLVVKKPSKTPILSWLPHCPAARNSSGDLLVNKKGGPKKT